MKLFKKKQIKHNETLFPSDRFEPVIRKSICTGEMTACMRDRETGKTHEVMVIRDSGDLEQFSAEYGADPAQIKTVY